MKCLLTLTMIILFTGIAHNWVPVGNETLIAIGCTKKVSGLTIKFVEVVQDSRCAKGNVCVWAGNAKIKIEVSRRNKNTRQFEIETNGPNRSADFEGIQITLKSLEPYPDAKNPTKNSDYKATLTIAN